MLSLKSTGLVLALSLGLSAALPHMALAESAAHGAAPAEHAEAGAVEHTASAEVPVAADTHATAHVDAHATEADHADGCDTDVLAKDMEIRKVNVIAAAAMLPPPGCTWPAEEVEVHAEVTGGAGDSGGHSAPAKSGGH